tara:strand:- start:86 stop:268 length:183 start_codon:yes stop_codon:yes gene_type:complete
MKILRAKIYPDEGELLSDLFCRMQHSVEMYTKKHKDTTAEVFKQEDCVLINSIKLGESAN